MGARHAGGLSRHPEFGAPWPTDRAQTSGPDRDGDEMTKQPKPASEPGGAQLILSHWQEAVPNDRLAHLVKDVTRAFVRALQTRLNRHSVSFGHWAFLRILWETDGLTQRELSDHAGVMEPTTFAAIKAMERLGYIV